MVTLVFLAQGCTSEGPSAPFSPEKKNIPSPTRPTGKQLQWTTFETGQNVKTLALDGPFLWMGLPSGIIKYDTRTQDRHQIYTISNTQAGFLARGIYKIKIDPEGNKWVATYGGGLSKFDGKQWTTFTPYGAGSTIYGPTWMIYTPGEGLGDLWVYDMVFGSKGEMWVATWEGASRFDGNRFTTYSEEAGLADKWVYSIAWEGDHILWFGTEGGVTRFDGSSWESYSHQDGLGADPTRLGTANLFRPNTSHHAQSEKKVGEPNPNYVLAIAIDQNHHKWFGTWGAGLTRFDGSTWTTYTRNEGLGGNFIHALSMDHEGNLWAGTDGGVSWYDGKQWHTLTTQDGLMDNNVFSFAFNKKEKWIGTWKGLNRLQMN
ncbi:MAG TPA: two-component regulator propeller domain-containing protein [Nitrospiria bacterium]